MKVKQIPALITAFFLLCSALTGCASGSTSPSEQPTSGQSTELVIFAAASMTETLTEAGRLYTDTHPDITLVFNFDSSGTLKTQIQEGADCDVFISAGQKQMNQLDISADPAVNTEGLDLVLSSSRFDFLESKVALAVPEGNPAGIHSYEDLRAGLKGGTILMAMGNADVPVGQYTQQILSWFELDEQALAAQGCITYGSNVKEVTSQVSEAAVDCGIIYATDAFSAGLPVVDTADSSMCGRVIYPAAILKNSAHTELAQEFLDFLTGETASDIFRSVGFSPLN